MKSQSSLVSLILVICSISSIFYCLLGRCVSSVYWLCLSQARSLSPSLSRSQRSLSSSLSPLLSLALYLSLSRPLSSSLSVCVVRLSLTRRSRVTALQNLLVQLGYMIEWLCWAAAFMCTLSHCRWHVCLSVSVSITYLLPHHYLSRYPH